MKFLSSVHPTRSLRGRLLFAAIIVEFAMLTLLVANSLRLLHGHMSEQVKRQSDQIAPVVIAALVAPMAQYDYSTVQAVLDESRDANGIVYMAVMDRGGKVVALSGWDSSKPLPKTSTSFPAFAGDTDTRLDRVTPIDLSGQHLGTLRFGLDLSHIVKAQRQLLSQGIAIAALELLLSSALLAILGFWLTRNLSQLTEASEEVTKGKLTPRTVMEGQDEIGQLGRAFNAMSRAVAERVNDLTLANQAQQALAATLENEHARMIALLEAMDVGILLVDTNNYVVYENPKFHDIWGTAPSEFFRGRDLKEVLPGICPTAHEDNFRNEFQRLDQRYIRQRCHVVTGGQGVTQQGWLWVFEDITMARLAAIELEQAKEAAEAGNQAKASFLANMSHEVRTPLSAIIGHSHILKRDLADPTQLSRAIKIERSAHHLLDIINDILDISKIEAGGLCIEQVEFDLEEMFENVITVIGDKANEKGLELVVDIANDVPRTVVGDPLRLSQIIINYANNAVKFTSHGEVAIRATVMRRDQQSLTLLFSVHDTGIGLNSEQSERIFNRFEQADSSITRKHGGSGLGLAISKYLAELMNGQVGVDSEPGKGSLFWFTAQLQAVDCPPQVVKAKPSFAGMHALVIEENRHANQVLCQQLHDIGFAVTSATSTSNALSGTTLIGAQDGFDAIFLDARILGEDAKESVRLLKSLSPISKPPRFTILCDQSTERSGSEIGHAVLNKPFLPRHLAEACRTMFARTEPTPADRVQPKPLRAHCRPVLLVEDIEINQEVTTDLLNSMGYEVEVASNGVEAVDLVTQRSYAAVLMDMQMPVMDGVTATIEIRKIARLASLPIIALTANAMDVDRQRCRDAGMDDFLPKPIDADLLNAKLARWCAQTNTPPSADKPKNESSECDRLKDISSLDVEGGVRRVAGNETIYLTMIKRFCEIHKGSADEIASLINTGQHGEAERGAHTIKGLASMIGAGEVQKAAFNLEQRLKHAPPGDEIPGLISALKTSVDALISEITIRLNEVPSMAS